MRHRGSIVPPSPAQSALNECFSLVYEELHHLADQVRRADPGASLNPTALVNEAWIKLAVSPNFTWTSALHFKRIAARAMRQFLVESARRRHALKRSVHLVTLDESLAGVLPADPVMNEDSFLRLDQALDALSALSPRQAVIVESRFFGGLSVEETAQVLAISEATVLRDWRAARAWLGRELRAAL